MDQPNPNNLFDLQIDAQSSGYLGETAKWAKFLAILGLICCSLGALIGVASMFMPTTTTTNYLDGSTRSRMFSGVFGGILIVLCTALYFMGYLYLYRFATKMQVALRGNDQQNLIDSFANLKSCFKFIGILTIVALSIFVLAFIGGIIFASSMLP